ILSGTESIQKSNIPLCEDLEPTQTWDLSSPTGHQEMKEFVNQIKYLDYWDMARIQRKS
ncbi:uncharacterized protein LOC126809479, partial [Patella vulgata]|uniref:uncharacterized protein LOC126809479 n=1 Tax=Patella vulgata TaxID=6465 RepID=UPI00217F32A2